MDSRAPASQACLRPWQKLLCSTIEGRGSGPLRGNSGFWPSRHHKWQIWHQALRILRSCPLRTLEGEGRERAGRIESAHTTQIPWGDT